MKPRFLALLSTLLVAAVAVAGCGSDSGGTGGSATSSTGGAAPEKAVFLKKGSAICAKGIAEIEKAFKAFAKEKNLAQGNELGKAEEDEVIEKILIPGISKQVEAIAALGAPAGDEEAVEAFLKRMEADLKKAKKDPTVLTTGTSFSKAREEAQEIGLAGCPAG